MARAKMSEGSRFDAVERARGTFEQVAVDEARAILAETEPEQEAVDCPFGIAVSGFLGLVTFGAYEVDDKAQAALAESLAAFVGAVDLGDATFYPTAEAARQAYSRR